MTPNIQKNYNNIIQRKIHHRRPFFRGTGRTAAKDSGDGRPSRASIHPPRTSVTKIRQGHPSRKSVKVIRQGRPSRKAVKDIRQGVYHTKTSTACLWTRATYIRGRSTSWPKCLPGTTNFHITIRNFYFSSFSCIPMP